MSTVLIVSNTAYNILHYRRTIWEELLCQGYKVTALAAPDAYAEELKAVGVGFHPLPGLSNYRSNPASVLRTYRQLKRAYRELRPAVILHFTIQANTVGSLAASHLGIPSAATITGLGSTWLRSAVSRWFVSLLYRHTLPKADLVITQNEDDRDSLTAAGVVAGWRHIPGSGVDLQHFGPRTATSWPTEKRFLYLGRMLIDKGIEELFAAWELACQAGMTGKLTLVGERPSAHPRVVPESIWRKGLALPRITFYPTQRDIRPFLEASHFVVLPSYREGLSRTLLEALATETPIITTSVPGCRQLVQDTGWVLPARSVQPLADALLAATQITAPNWREMGKNGRTLVTREYSAAHVAAQYLEVVHQLAAR